MFAIGDYMHYEIWAGLCVSIASLYSQLFDNFVDLWCLTSALLLSIILNKLMSKLLNESIQQEQEDQV